MFLVAVVSFSLILGFVVGYFFSQRRYPEGGESMAICLEYHEGKQFPLTVKYDLRKQKQKDSGLCELPDCLSFRKWIKYKPGFTGKIYGEVWFKREVRK